MNKLLEWISVCLTVVVLLLSVEVRSLNHVISNNHSYMKGLWLCRSDLDYANGRIEADKKLIINLNKKRGIK